MSSRASLCEIIASAWPAATPPQQNITQFLITLPLSLPTTHTHTQRGKNQPQEEFHPHQACGAGREPVGQEEAGGGEMATRTRRQLLSASGTYGGKGGREGGREGVSVEGC